MSVYLVALYIELDNPVVLPYPFVDVEAVLGYFFEALRLCWSLRSLWSWSPGRWCGGGCFLGVWVDEVVVLVLDVY